MELTCPDGWLCMLTLLILCGLPEQCWTVIATARLPGPLQSSIACVGGLDANKYRHVLNLLFCCCCCRYENFLRSSKPGAWDHVKSLKDMLTVHLTPEPTAAAVGGESTTATGTARSAAASGGGAEQGTGVPWVCPIAHVPLGRYPCCALKACGHVFSKKVLDELLSSVGKGRTANPARSGTSAIAAGNGTSTGWVGGSTLATEGARVMDDGGRSSTSETAGARSASAAAGATDGAPIAGGQGTRCKSVSTSSSARSSSCPVCGISFEAEDLLPLNGTMEQEAVLLARLRASRSASGGKGQKKRKASECAAGEEGKLKQLRCTGTAGVHDLTCKRRGDEDG